MDGNQFSGTHQMTWKQTLAADAREWRAKRAELDERIRKDTQELEALDEKLSHAIALLGPEFRLEALRAATASISAHAALPVFPQDDDDDEASHAAVVGAAIDEVLKGAPHGLKTPKLRAAVMNNPDAAKRIEERPNRFYAILYRRVSGGKIVKRGKTYRLASSVSPQGETGAVAAPASR
jgi:hypothetical protein